MLHLIQVFSLDLMDMKSMKNPNHYFYKCLWFQC